jgi:hypothetical protein
MRYHNVYEFSDIENHNKSFFFFFLIKFNIKKDTIYIYSLVQ